MMTSCCIYLLPLVYILHICVPIQLHIISWQKTILLHHGLQLLLDEALEELRKKAVDRAILLAAERRKKAGIRTGQTCRTRGSIYIYNIIYILCEEMLYLEMSYK